MSELSKASRTPGRIVLDETAGHSAQSARGGKVLGSTCNGMQRVLAQMLCVLSDGSRPIADRLVKRGIPHPLGRIVLDDTAGHSAPSARGGKVLGSTLHRYATRPRSNQRCCSRCANHMVRLNAEAVPLMDEPGQWPARRDRTSGKKNNNTDKDEENKEAKNRPHA